MSQIVQNKRIIFVKISSFLQALKGLLFLFGCIIGHRKVDIGLYKMLVHIYDLGIANNGLV